MWLKMGSIRPDRATSFHSVMLPVLIDVLDPMEELRRLGIHAGRQRSGAGFGSGKLSRIAGCDQLPLRRFELERLSLLAELEPSCYSIKVPEGPHVLVVEDEPFVAQAIIEALEDEYSVSTAATVAEAVRQVRQTEFALVLLDCLLPDGDSAEIIAAAEAREASIILMSGDVEQTYSARGLPFLSKPFSIEELLKTLRDVLHLSLVGPLNRLRRDTAPVSRLSPPIHQQVPWVASVPTLTFVAHGLPFRGWRRPRRAALWCSR
jgi:CheY-like chemotaxis protein